MGLNKNFNIPNILSVYRLCAVPLLLFFVFKDMEATFASFLVLSLTSDIADGFIARKDEKTSKIGASLDSIGDAITFIIAMYGAWHFHQSFFIEHLYLIISGFIFYIIQILTSTIKFGKPSSFHTYLAKAAAILQGCFFLIMFFFEPFTWLFYLVFIITILELIEEIILVFMIPVWRADVKGIFWLLRK